MKRLKNFFERLNYLDETILRVETELCYLIKGTTSYYKKHDYLGKIIIQRNELV